MKISNLPAATTMANNDVLVKETAAGVTQKITISNFMARKNQMIGYDTTPKQMNSDIMSCSLVLFVIRRYGYFDSFVVPIGLVTSGVTSAGIHRTYNTNDILIGISSTGLITLTGNGASDLVIELYEI